jgi:SAM-dependent methyltransferase
VKRCLTCEAGFDADGWTCPACGFAPSFQDGFACFAPDLAFENDGMPVDAHHQLDAVQDSSFWFRVRRQLIQDIVRKRSAQAAHVLEIGCGTGYMLGGLRSVLPEAELFASEIYLNGLPYAAKRVTAPSQFFQMDARHIPFRSHFDLVCAFDVLEHVDEDEQVLAQIHAALKPGGAILATVPQHMALWSKADTIACHKRRYARHELAEKTERAGFTGIWQTSFSTLLLPMMFAARRFGSRKESYTPSDELTLPWGGSRVVWAQKSS